MTAADALVRGRAALTGLAVLGRLLGLPAAAVQSVGRLLTGLGQRHFLSVCCFIETGQLLFQPACIAFPSFRLFCLFFQLSA